ncbi:MAG: PIN domain-containing protein [Acidobacteria bacterium]|nr:PIN domain-containing protein [Acidobacteriota bacterium]
MTPTLVDSSAFLAIEDPSERSHSRATSALRKLVAARTKLLTTNFIFDETYTLILTRLGRRRAVEWGKAFKSGNLVQLVRVQEEHETFAWEILMTFADKDFSYTDATSFALAESLEFEQAFAVDDHFRQYGRIRVVP